MRTLSFTLVGTSPLLLHHTSKHQFREVIAAQQIGKTLENEAKEVMSIDERGHPVVPASWLLDSIRAGCARIVVEGKQVSFVSVSSMIRLPDDPIPLKDTDNHMPVWKLYKSAQHLRPGSKRLIAVVAPQFDDWMLSLEIKIFGLFPSDALLLRIMDEAGRCGIGLFHPPKKHFGQFRVCSQGASGSS